MAKERQWLQAEQSGQDKLAEKMFARVVAEMPPFEPGPQFVGRTVQAAWHARTRRRLLRPVALTAAALLISIGGLGAIYALAAPATSLAVRATVLFLHGLAWLLTSASEGARWWWIVERIGTAARDSITAPSMAASIAAIEMIALLAIYAFGRLLAEDVEQHKAR